MQKTEILCKTNEASHEIPQLHMLQIQHQPKKYSNDDEQKSNCILSKEKLYHHVPENKIVEGRNPIRLSRVTSFLRHDNSFLTPWSWNPAFHREQSSSWRVISKGKGLIKKGKELIMKKKVSRMRFPTGSFFSRQFDEYFGLKTKGTSKEGEQEEVPNNEQQEKVQVEQKESYLPSYDEKQEELQLEEEFERNCIKLASLNIPKDIEEEEEKYHFPTYNGHQKDVQVQEVEQKEYSLLAHLGHQKDMQVEEVEQQEYQQDMEVQEDDEENLEKNFHPSTYDLQQEDNEHILSQKKKALSRGIKIKICSSSTNQID